MRPSIPAQADPGDSDYDHLLSTLDDVREATYWWMIGYNEERPHDALDDLAPMEARLLSAGNSTYEL